MWVYLRVQGALRGQQGALKYSHHKPSSPLPASVPPLDHNTQPPMQDSQTTWPWLQWLVNWSRLTTRSTAWGRPERKKSKCLILLWLYLSRSKVRLTNIIFNSFCFWIRILFLIIIWFSLGSSSPIYSVTGSAMPITLELFIAIRQWYVNIQVLKASSTVDWRWRAPGKPDSNEEKNSNPITGTVISIFLHFYNKLLLS